MSQTGLCRAHILPWLGLSSPSLSVSLRLIYPTRPCQNTGSRTKRTSANTATSTSPTTHPPASQHESGLEHKRNVKRFVRGFYKAGQKHQQNFNKEGRGIARIEKVRTSSFVPPTLRLRVLCPSARHDTPRPVPHLSSLLPFLTALVFVKMHITTLPLTSRPDWQQMPHMRRTSTPGHPTVPVAPVSSRPRPPALVRDRIRPKVVEPDIDLDTERAREAERASGKSSRWTRPHSTMLQDRAG